MRRQRGFTFIEAMIVVAIIALIAVLAGGQINKSYQRTRLEGAAADVRAFLQSAFVFMNNNRSPVHVRVVPGAPTRLQITQNADGSGRVFSTYVVPDFVQLNVLAWPCGCATACTVTASTPGVLQCDATGRAVNAFCGPPPTMVDQPQTIIVTHKDMVSGQLKPNTVYIVQVYPLWNVRSVKSVSAV